VDQNRAIYAISGFLIAFAVSMVAAIVARRRAGSGTEDELAGRSLSRRAVGLSAATTGVSGFVVTGAVGMGYAGGVSALIVPLGWFLGDLLFWAVFPGRLNAIARSSGAVTIPELIAEPADGRWKKLVVALSAIVTVIFLTPYACAQWVAGQKIFSSIVSLPGWISIAVIAGLVIVYSSIGGFRGSVYTDMVQAVIRVGGTLVAIVGLLVAALRTPEFAANIRAAGPEFLFLFPSGLLAGTAVLLGFAGFAVAFGLGQPHVTSRFLAGSSPQETRAARWIYIGFMQGTWITMTVFGILLRGVMPGLTDPEQGLSLFFAARMNPLIAGIIFADIFATLAATANGILVVVAQILRRNLAPLAMRGRGGFTVIALGAFSIALSTLLPPSVAQIVIASNSLMGAGLGGVVMIRAMGWRVTGPSLLAAILTGFFSGLGWRLAGLSDYFNESAVGLVAALAVNALLSDCVAAKKKPLV
jgi:Na+/proline symporter